MRLQLEGRQTQLIAMLDRLEGILALPTMPAIVLLGELRVAARDMMAEHFRFREEIFHELRGFGIVHVDRQVARCRSAMLAIQVAHRFHVLDWNAEAIAADWPGFVANSRKLATRMRALVDLDRDHLYPLIDQLLGDRIHAVETAGAQAFARTLANVDRVA